MSIDRASTPHLVVTADDVGLHRGFTEGAVRAHREGIVTACSVAACGRELAHGREHLSECPAIDVGVHLMLVDGPAVRPVRTIPSLLTGDGVLPTGYREFVARYVLGRIRPSEVEDECRAQIERLLAMGFALVHLNSHQHVHVLPQIFDICIKLAQAYAIPYVRVPDDGTQGRASLCRRLAVSGLSALGRRARQKARIAAVGTNDRTAGISEAGHLDRDAILRLLPVSPGLTELITHPGVGNASLSECYDWQYAWDEETAALCDPTIRAAVSERGIGLVSIRRHTPTTNTHR